MLFAITLSLLIGSAFSEAFYDATKINYGSLNRTKTKYTGTNQWGTQAQRLNYKPGGYVSTPYNTDYGQRQVQISPPYKGNIGQQQYQTNYPSSGPSYGWKVGQQWNDGNDGQYPIQNSPPYNGDIGQKPISTYPNARPSYGWNVGQQQMDDSYDPYGNQQQVQEEIIVPIKAYRTGGASSRNNGYGSKQPVKTTYYTK